MPHSPLVAISVKIHAGVRIARTLELKGALLVGTARNSELVAPRISKFRGSSSWWSEGKEKHLKVRCSFTGDLTTFTIIKVSIIGGMAQRMHAPSGCLAPVDFPSGQERFHTHLLDGKGARQVWL